MKYLGASEVCLTKRIQGTEERTSDIEDNVQEIDTSVKENIKCKKKNQGTKHSGKLVHCKTPKSMRNRKRRRRN